MKNLTTLTILFVLTCLKIQAIPLHVLAWDQTIAKREFSVTAGTRSTLVTDMHHLSRSKPINVSAKSENLRLTVNDRKDEEGNPLFIPLSIPEGATRVLLLLTPDKKSPTGIKSLVLNDSLTGFGWGAMRFLNLTNLNLALKAETKAIAIPPGWKPVTMNLKGDTRNFSSKIYRREDLNGKPLYSSIWQHTNRLRKLIIIIPTTDRGRGALDFKIITENRAALEAQEARAREEQRNL